MSKSLRVETGSSPSTMQNPPAYVQVGGNTSLYAPSRGDSDLNMPGLYSHHHHLGIHSSPVTSSAGSSAMDSLNAARGHPLHARYGSKPHGVMIPGLPTFPPHPHLQHPHRMGGSGAFVDNPNVQQSSHLHTSSLNDAFVNSFGLTSSSFLNPVYFDRNRTPSPNLHRLLHNQLLGGHPAAGDNQFLHDDFSLDSGSNFRGLNLSTGFGGIERPHSDPLMSSGHLSRSLDDLSVVLDNSNDSVDLSLPHRDSSSPDDSLSCHDITQSENVSSSAGSVRNHPTSTTRSTSSTLHNHNSTTHHSSAKQRRLNGRGEAAISRTCPTCGKSFGNSSGLAKHRLTHSDERKYLCNVCMKSFKRQDHLSGHMLTHSEKKPFECPVESCGKSYCDSRSLKRHLDQHEAWLVPDSVRLMYNDTAGDDFDDTRSELDGSQSGSDLKPFVCQICRKRFKNGPALNGHMRLHGGFFTKKGGELYSSAPASVQPIKLQDPQPHTPSDMDLHELSPLTTGPSQAPWSTSNQDVADPVGLSQTLNLNNPLNHVNVIRHVAPSLRSALPPVSTLASPTNSPTTLTPPYSFFTGSVSPTSPIPPPPSQAPASHFSISNLSQSTLALPVVNGKIRRHSDSDNVIPAKRLKPTVTDRLKQTISMNMARKHGGSPDADQLNVFSFRPEHTHEASVFDGPLDEGRNDTFFPNDFRHSLFGGGIVSNFGGGGSVMGPNDSRPFIQEPVQSPGSVNSSGSSSTADYPDSGSLESPPPPLKRKHRPGPLYIPPQPATPEFYDNVHQDSQHLSPASHALRLSTSQQSPPANSLLSPGRFNSRLRSPLPLGGEKSSSPPPYTPPPMLSPNRQGSGLFWNVMNSASNGTTTPQSGTKFLLRRSLSSSSAGHLDTQGYLQRSASGAIKDELDPRESPFYFGPPIEAPVTDLNPHINIGDRHQADLPAFIGPVCDSTSDSPEDLLWSADVMRHLDDQEVKRYLAMAGSGLAPKGGANNEVAHHLLFLTGGDICHSTRALLSTDSLLSTVPYHHPIREYRYQESDLWNADEITAFASSVLKHDKDFFLVSSAVGSKSTKQCIEFYYCWKKLFPDDYKRVRLTRSRIRRQEDLVTRSKAGNEELEQREVTPPPRKPDAPKVSSEGGRSKDAGGPYMCPQPGCGNSFATKQALSAHSRVHLPRSSNRVAVTLDMCPPPNPKSTATAAGSTQSSGRRTATTASFVQVSSSAEPEPTEFPCRLCGKVFQGVKSRNAHMKVHRLTENQSSATVSQPAH